MLDASFVIRIQKFLSNAGVTSRRHAEDLILQGRVQVNGEIVKRLGTKIDPETDEVRIDGKVVKPPQGFVYVAYYKPRGVITTLKDPFGRLSITDQLFKEMAQKGLPRLHHVGRLDKDSEGLLILTNDGELTHNLLHPSKKMEKTYVVKVKGHPSKNALDRLRKGVEIDGRSTLPCKIRVVTRSKSTTTLEFRLKEGRKRQIRRMLKRIGSPVLELKRTRMGPVAIGGLRPGQWRFLQKEEVDAIKEYCFSCRDRSPSSCR